MNDYAFDAFGLPLGDRVLLALAGTGKLTALTADRIRTDANRAAEVEVDVIPGHGDGEPTR